MITSHHVNRQLALVMAGFLAATGVACTIDARGSRATGGFERSLAANGPIELSVKTGSGSIRINTSTDNEVRIVGRIEAQERLWSSSSVTDRVHEIEAHPPIVQHGNTIEVGQLEPHLANNVSISYEITMPAAARLELRSGSGDQSVAAARGPVDARTGSGGIRLGDIQGAVSAVIGSGDIEVASATGLRATTGSGSINVREVSGGVTARTGSGNIEIGGKPAEAWSIMAGSGSIALHVEDGAPFELEARTGSGSIHATPAIEVSHAPSRNQLIGRAHGGGPRVQLTTGSGNIHVEASPKPAAF